MATKSTSKTKSTKTTNTKVNVVLDAGDVETKTETFNDNIEVKNDATEFVAVKVPETQQVETRVNWIHRHI